MLYKTKYAVCSEIRTKHMNAMGAPSRIFRRVPKIAKSDYELRLLSGCLSARNNSAATERIFMKFDI
jgi:hypothetical protein